jgi:hypothetical protein
MLKGAAKAPLPHNNPSLGGFAAWRLSLRRRGYWLLARFVRADASVLAVRAAACRPAVFVRTAPAGAADAGSSWVWHERRASGLRARTNLARVAAGIALGRRRARLAHPRPVALIAAAVAKRAAVAARLTLPRALPAREARRAVCGLATRAIRSLHARATVSAGGAEAAVVAAAARIGSGLAVAGPIATAIAERAVAACLALRGRRVARLAGRTIARSRARGSAAFAQGRALARLASAFAAAGRAFVLAAGLRARAVRGAPGGRARLVLRSSGGGAAALGIDRSAAGLCVLGVLRSDAHRSIAPRIDRRAGARCAIDEWVSVCRVARRARPLERDGATRKRRGSECRCKRDDERRARSPEALRELSHLWSVPSP